SLGKGVLQIRLLDDKGKSIETTDLPVRVQVPAQYVTAEAAFVGEAGDRKLVVTLRDRKPEGQPFTGPPAKVRLDLSPERIPALVRLEADNPPPATAVTEFGFDRSATGTYETVRLPGEREQRVGLRPGGPDDAIVFVTAVHDWVRDLSTAGVYGTRQLRLRLL